MRPSPALTMTALGAMTLAACATINVGAAFSPSTNFQSFSTYTWELQDDLPTGEPRLDKNPFFDARSKRVIWRGWAQAPIWPIC